MYSRRMMTDSTKNRKTVASSPKKKAQMINPKSIHQIRIRGRKVSMTAGSTPKSVYFSRERNPIVAAVRSNKTPTERQMVGMSTVAHCNKFDAKINQNRWLLPWQGVLNLFGNFPCVFPLVWVECGRNDGNSICLRQPPTRSRLIQTEASILIGMLEIPICNLKMLIF